MKYIIKLKEDRQFSVRLDHPDNVFADVEHGLYVAEKNATRFSSRKEAEHFLHRPDEEIVEVSE